MVLAQTLYSAKNNIYILDEYAIDDARERFKELQDSGVIVRGSFDDKVWYTTNEYENIGFHFRFDVFSYAKYEKVFGMDLDTFLLHLKAFLLTLFGKYALESIRTMLRDMIHIIQSDLDSVLTSNDITIHSPILCKEFLSYLSENEENQKLTALINNMDKYLVTKQSSARALASFHSYFLFDDILNDYWKSDLPIEERLFYYPLYIWWSLTAVVPLRPREFILTKRNCLSTDKNGNYFMQIRRNHIKGHNSGIAYTIDGDYDIFTFQIPVSLGEEIQKYITLTKDMASTDIDTLFIQDLHYRKWSRSRPVNSRFFTYTNLNTLLQYFYLEIVEKKYRKRIIYERDDHVLDDDEIQYIHLGDTRHLSLVNQIQEGVSPVVAMQLAGHTNLSTSSHYYTNIESLIDCVTYRQFKKLTTAEKEYRISASLSTTRCSNGSPLSDGGTCFSVNYEDGYYEDCVKVFGPNGEIGHCPSCPHYKRPGVAYSSSADIYKRNLRQSTDALYQAVSAVRKGIGANEDIYEALLRVKHSATSYKNYCIDKRIRDEQADYAEKENLYGTKQGN